MAARARRAALRLYQRSYRPILASRVWFGYTPVGSPGGGGGPAGQKIYYVTELQHHSTTLYQGGSQGLMWLEINGNGPSGNVIFIYVFVGREHE